jgi:hypothetical protein
MIAKKVGKLRCGILQKNGENEVYSRIGKRLALKPKLDLERSLWPSSVLFEEINALKRQLKPEKTASSKKRKAESILTTEINLTTSSDEGEQWE